jgi:hypothetical protein
MQAGKEHEWPLLVDFGFGSGVFAKEIRKAGQCCMA